MDPDELVGLLTPFLVLLGVVAAVTGVVYFIMGLRRGRGSTCPFGASFGLTSTWSPSSPCWCSSAAWLT